MMKKYLYSLSAIILLFSICSCKEKSPVTNITVSNPRTEFKLGEKFETGRDCIIITEFEDGSKKFLKQKDCSFYFNDVPVKKFKFKTSGNYIIKAEYKEASTQYNINVIDQGIIERYNLLPIYYIIINFIALIAFYIDKERAKKHSENRISEFSLFAISYIGGGIGALLGMIICSHKTRKIKFRIFIPISIILHIGIILFLKNII